MLLLLIFLLINVSKQAFGIDHDLDLNWSEFKRAYHKNYSTLAEESKRRSIWEENLNFIQLHNQENYSYTLKMNKYGDMSNTEFNQALNNLNSAQIIKLYNPINTDEPTPVSSNAHIPQSIDWRKLGFVTKVKDQQYCSSGWAFAAIAAVEAQYRNATSELVSFSEQILLDCPFKSKLSSCSGGTIVQGFLSVNWNGGAFKSKLYPYKGESQKCNFSETSNLFEFFVTDLIKIQSPNKKTHTLTQLVATTGPVAAYLNAHDRSFQFYEKGVYSSDSCDTNEANHAVTIVGYNTQSNDSKSQLPTDEGGYYIIKNSYGTDWGMDGYMWLSREPTNKCGVGLRAYSPILFIL